MYEKPTYKVEEGSNQSTRPLTTNDNDAKPTAHHSFTFDPKVAVVVKDENYGSNNGKEGERKKEGKIRKSLSIRKKSPFLE